MTPKSQDSSADDKWFASLLWLTIIMVPPAAVFLFSSRTRRKITWGAFLIALICLAPTIATYNRFIQMHEEGKKYLPTAIGKVQADALVEKLDDQIKEAERDNMIINDQIAQANSDNDLVMKSKRVTSSAEMVEIRRENRRLNQEKIRLKHLLKWLNEAKTKAEKEKNNLTPSTTPTGDFATLTAASIGAEATMVGGLVALFTAIVAGMSILYSVFALIEQKRHEERIHQENYNKDILKAFNESEDVRNGKIILEAVSRDSIYLPVLHLNLYHTNESPVSRRAHTKYEFASKFYPNDGTEARLPYKPPTPGKDTATTVLTDKELSEVIPTMDDLIAALTPDDNENELTLLGNKICYSFDAFLEIYITIGRLQIIHMKEARLSSKDDLQHDDIDVWWDAIDMPYWSRLIMWGTDDVIDTPKDPFRPDLYTSEKEEKKVLAQKNKELRPKIADWKTKDGELLERWQGLRFEEAYKDVGAAIEQGSTSNQWNGHLDSRFVARCMIRSYISSYYDEALKIAFLLSVYGDSSQNEKDASKTVYDKIKGDEDASEDEAIEDWIKGESEEGEDEEEEDAVEAARKAIQFAKHVSDAGLTQVARGAAATAVKLAKEVQKQADEAVKPATGVKDEANINRDETDSANEEAKKRAQNAEDIVREAEELKGQVEGKVKTPTPPETGQSEQKTAILETDTTKPSSEAPPASEAVMVEGNTP